VEGPVVKDSFRKDSDCDTEASSAEEASSSLHEEEPNFEEELRYHPNWEMRHRAAVAISCSQQYEPTKIVQLLAVALRDADRDVREVGARGLSRWVAHAADVRQELERALHDRDQFVCIAVAKALQEMDSVDSCCSRASVRRQPLADDEMKRCSRPRSVQFADSLELELKDSFTRSGPEPGEVWRQREAGLLISHTALLRGACIGESVVLCGLEDETFNGRTGRIVGLRSDGRREVLLEGVDRVQLAVKGANVSSYCKRYSRPGVGLVMQPVQYRSPVILCQAIGSMVA